VFCELVSSDDRFDRVITDFLGWHGPCDSGVTTTTDRRSYHLTTVPKKFA
jgi:hypothetical protein